MPPSRLSAGTPARTGGWRRRGRPRAGRTTRRTRRRRRAALAVIGRVQVTPASLVAKNPVRLPPVVGDGVRPIGVAGRVRDADAAEARSQRSVTVRNGADVPSAAASVDRCRPEPGPPYSRPVAQLVPQRGQDHVGRLGLMDTSIAPVELFGPLHAAPGEPAILGQVQAAVAAGVEQPALRGDEDPPRVGRVDPDASDRAGLPQTEADPGPSAVGRAVHAGAVVRARRRGPARPCRRKGALGAIASAPIDWAR